MIIIGGCATTSKTKEEREGVNQEIFFQSVKSGDIAEVNRLIGEGADVNAQNNDGWTALMLASDLENPEIAKLLIEEGADVNAQDNEVWTALLWASAYGHCSASDGIGQSGMIE